MSELESDVDEHLATLEQKSSELTQACLFRSAQRVANEIQRTSRAERRLIPYLHATFTVMNQAADLLNPEAGRDAAIEIISLLESEDRARSLQPDLDEGEYSGTVNWLSSCAYDNLAKATASMNGYNSDGVHACIADGIQVCRRTGKLQCIACFREYATDVYRAADDLDMAIHFARVGIAHEKPGPHDRRWVGAKDLTRLLLLSGRLSAAAEALEQAWDLVETWHSPLNALLQMKLLTRELVQLSGDAQRWESRLAASTSSETPPPAGEYPWLEMRRDHVEALEASSAGDHAKAIATLTEWDRRLQRGKCLHDWFETRLRLLAVHRLAGNKPEFDRLAAQLEQSAQPSRDWLTLRGLARLRDPAARITPYPMVADPDSGPFAAPVVAGAEAAAPSEPLASEPAAAAADTVASAQAESANAPPPFIVECWGKLRMMHADESIDDERREAIANEVLADILAVDPQASRTASDASWLLHTVRYLPTVDLRATEVWPWAQAIAAPHLQDAATVNLLATLGSRLQFGADDPEINLVPIEHLEKLFRESLDLDPNNPRNFERAGDFFLTVDNVGEAERCFARGHRLDRGNAEIAKKLARVYRGTEREREALTVLDMSLREGADDLELLWQAGLSAHSIGRFDAAVTYLDEYEKRIPGEAWVNYYKASSLLELKRPAEALAATEQEAQRNPECPFPVAVQRAVGTAGLGEVIPFREYLSAVLELPLVNIDYFTVSGVRNLLTSLWTATSELLPADDPLRRRLEDRVVAASLAPDELFDAVRQQGEASDGVGFYECLVRQPLDERWPQWPGCLAHEVEWPAYIAGWGVLARSEEEAAELVQAWQRRAFPLPAEVQQIQLQSEGYRERVGVVWQGVRDAAE